MLPKSRQPDLHRSHMESGITADARAARVLFLAFLLSGDIYEDAKRHNVVFVGKMCIRDRVVTI